MLRAPRFLPLAAAAALAAACAGQTLNSERIEREFGSYSVRVIEQGAQWRVTSLESLHGGAPVTRTLALVRFDNAGHAAFAAEEAAIRRGASIGATFKSAGFRIAKAPVCSGRIVAGPEAAAVGVLMEIPLPSGLAMHAYRFDVGRGGNRLAFATIVELYHPDYLSLADVERITGSDVPPCDRSAGPLVDRLEGVLARLTVS